MNSVDLVLIFNKSNKYGIARDVQGIMNSVSKSMRVELRDCAEPPQPCGMAVHLEIPIYAWMPWAATNILVVNPEWFDPAWVSYMPRFKYVVYKDAISASQAMLAGYVTEKQVKVIPWGASEPQPVEGKVGDKNTGFVWFLGGSQTKRAYVPKLLSMWRESYPPLRIYAVDPLDISGCTTNVRLEVMNLDTPMRLSLGKFFRGHVACSIAEGFSYAAAEAEWNGAFTLLNELNCFKSDYTGQEGVQILNGTQENLDAAIQEFEKADLTAIAVARKARATERYKSFLDTIGKFLESVRTVAPKSLPPALNTEQYPPISIVTLLYNRRRFFDLACHNILQSDYPKDKIEWVIVEDSDDPMEGASDLVAAVANQSNSVKIVYIPMKRTSVAKKRNVGVEKATAEIILMMDDDDHYPVTSFRRRVSWLNHPWKPKAVAATTIACYDLLKGISAVNIPPLNLPLSQRISEATLTFYKSWWVERGFPDSVQVGEGEEFLAGREKDVLEIPPQQIIVAFSHGRNLSSRRIPSNDGVKPGCFWGFPKEYIIFVHKLAGVTVVEN